MRLLKKKCMLVIYIVLVLVLMLVGCGSKDSSELILGRWILEEDNTAGYEFFSDGEVIAFFDDDQETANWSISDNSLKLSEPFGTEAIVLSIEELTDERMVLSVEDNEIVLIKATE